MKCVIPAAGFGTRMGELCENTPKTLLKVKGKFLLDHIIQKVLEIPDINEIVIVSNAKFYPQFESWIKKTNYNVPVRLINNGVM